MKPQTQPICLFKNRHTFLLEFHIQSVAMRNVNVFTFPLTLNFKRRITKIILVQMLI